MAVLLIWQYDCNYEKEMKLLVLTIPIILFFLKITIILQRLCVIKLSGYLSSISQDYRVDFVHYTRFTRFLHDCKIFRNYIQND